MAVPPPSYTSSASVSRSKKSRGDMSAIADSMLRSSLSHSASSSASPALGSSASVSRAQGPREKLSSLADDMLRSSLSSSLSVSSTPSVSITPPVYPSKRSATPAPPSILPGRPSVQNDSAKLQKIQLQQEVDRANAQAPERGTAGLFKAACSTDLLFLIDTTGSMGSYIESAKEQVRSIVTDVKEAFLNESQVRIAVVGYKDHQDSPNIEFLDFTPSADEVSMFLNRLTATGGGDMPEDVLGGVQKALHASWQQQTRCVIHIADAPPHGRELHDLSEAYDNYYKTGSEPHGLTCEPLIRQLVQLNINYALLRITSYTDRMALAFARVYGNANAKLLPTNTHYSQMSAGKVTSGGAGTSTKRSLTTGTGPQFEELQLGTTYSMLRHLVVRTVTSSVSRTAGRLSMALSRASTAHGVASPKDLTIIREDEGSDGVSDSVKLCLESDPPQWTTPGWLDETLEVEGFCPAVVVHNASTLNDMMAADENIKLSVAALTIHARSKPFARGSLRAASYARAAASTNRFVVKSFIRNGHGRAEVAEDMRIQALCKAFALEFNGLLNIEPPLDFVVTACLQRKPKVASGKEAECFSFEPFIERNYVKYNTNGLWVNEDLADDPFNQMAQAFSHFTFERSWGHLLVNDLQGVDHLLTDPAIQTRDHNRFKLSDTNLNEEGFKFFFALHKCNSVCVKLGLKSTGAMFVSGEFEFRKRWPTMDPTVCCSNKLCRSIVRLTSAHTSSKYPGLHWCDTCWPQLQSSTTRWICVEPGPNHEFEVSRFFYESQGQLTPRKCPAHLEKDTTGSSAAAVGGSLWSRMKSTGPKGSISGRSW